MSPEQRAQIQRRLAAVAEERALAPPPSKPVLVTNSTAKRGRPAKPDPSPAALRKRKSRASGAKR